MKYIVSVPFLHGTSRYIMDYHEAVGGIPTTERKKAKRFDTVEEADSFMKKCELPFYAVFVYDEANDKIIESVNR